MYTVLESIGTANPPFKVSQSDLSHFMRRVEGVSPAVRSRMAGIYARSGIDYRHSCLSDYESEPGQFQFYPQNWSLQPTPTTAKRNQYYRHAALEIAERAAQDAIAQSKLQAADLTHLIVVSCTGFSAPGLDIHLIKHLRLSPEINRTLIGFMGCNAAFNGFKMAHSICQSHPQARVLIICVELCTLHFQIEDSIESMVINALFADGAGAAIFSARSLQEAQGQLAYVDGSSVLVEDTLDLMSWTIGNTGFLMGLSSDVPKVIAKHLPSYLKALLDRHNLDQETLDFWAIHPGGRQIVDQIQSGLGLSSGLVCDSYEVLRQYGNMSSATILFILKRLLEKHQAGLGYQNGIALAFGPGLSIEGCLFQQVLESSS
ncbi:type III polyketide synthase [Leptolyngbya sp. NIES-2104]|uniref:type III polyketide synthase n=1 Tax=Leptolyngbya sp. NIES-2104 TaxID=1552121 RepID=UPI0006ECB9E9|nr:type III polyketide synthase [Leptolyngbya sp. NIES-2104]GAP99536.1 chalcone synthase [Leptolyngbya sp. NIES-2104]